MRWEACLAASSKVGLGHLVRVQAIFDAAGIIPNQVWVWTDWSQNHFDDFVRPSYFRPVPMATEYWPGDILPDGILVDMPNPPRALLEQTSQVSKKLLLGCSDSRREWADLTINVAEGGPLDMPQPPPTARQWEGARFALLRKEFLSRHPRRYNANGPLLLIMGGTDAARITFKATCILVNSELCTNRRLRVVIPAVSPDRPHLESLARHYPMLMIHTPSPQISEWILDSSAAIVAPGNLLFECLALDTPALAIPQNTKQQVDFVYYPWLLMLPEIRNLPDALNSLMISDLCQWFAYSRRAAAGQSLSMIIEWIQSGD